MRRRCEKGSRMDPIAATLTRAQRRREARAQPKQLRKGQRTPRSKFFLEPLEQRVLLNGDAVPFADIVQSAAVSPLVITQFAPTPGGFTARFDQAIDVSVVSLFDTEAGALGPADITVAGTNAGAIKGSLVVQNDHIEFIKTGGILAPDTYTVALRSAENGLEGTTGELLDGNNDGNAGDNYSAIYHQSAIGHGGDCRFGARPWTSRSRSSHQ